MPDDWHQVTLQAWARQDGLLWEVRLPSGRIIQFTLDEFSECFTRLDGEDVAWLYYDTEEEGKE